MLLFRWIYSLLSLQIVSSLPTPTTNNIVRKSTDTTPAQTIQIIGQSQLAMTVVFSSAGGTTDMLPAAILTIVTDVTGFIEKIIDTLENLDAAESRFTTEVVSQLNTQYPDKNILIYHGKCEISLCNDCLGDATCCPIGHTILFIPNL